MDIDDAFDRQYGQLLQTSIHASNWQVPHRTRCFLTNAQADQLIIVPTCAIDQQTNAILQLAEHTLAQLLYCWHVDNSTTSVFVDDPITNDRLRVDHWLYSIHDGLATQRGEGLAEQPAVFSVHVT